MELMVPVGIPERVRSVPKVFLRLFAEIRAGSIPWFEAVVFILSVIAFVVNFRFFPLPFLEKNLSSGRS